MEDDSCCIVDSTLPARPATSFSPTAPAPSLFAKVPEPVEEPNSLAPPRPPPDPTPAHTPNLAPALAPLQPLPKPPAPRVPFLSSPPIQALGRPPAPTCRSGWPTANSYPPIAPFLPLTSPNRYLTSPELARRRIALRPERADQSAYAHARLRGAPTPRASRIRQEGDRDHAQITENQ